MNISLSPGMLKEVEAASKAEHRTHSELAAIARGRAEIRRVKYVTLNRLANDLESRNRKARHDSTRKASR